MGDTDTTLNEIEDTLKIKADQLVAVEKAMTVFLDTDDWGEASAEILRCALTQTNSEYGFVGVVLKGPVLRILSQEGIEWHSRAGRTLYDAAIRTYRELGYLEFTSFDNLFGRVITDGKTVISNNPALDRRSGGLPAGHPPLNSFMGVPVLRRGEVVGLIGVANRPGGYIGTERANIEVLCRSTGVLYDSYRRKQREAELEEDAESAKRLKERLLANMRHEIRTPMTAILGYAEVLKERLSHNREALEDLEIIEHTGHNNLETHKNVHDLAEIEAGNVRIEPSLCSPARIATRILSSLLTKASAKRITLDIHYETPIPHIICSDPVRFEQSVSILVGNAIKFTGAGSVVLSLRQVHDDGRERRLELRVADTGIGICEDELERIFEPFSQVDPSASRKHGGAGLGLAICRTLARFLGGDVTVKSEVGVGTEFTLSIPCSGTEHGSFHKPTSRRINDQLVTIGESLRGP